MGEGNGTGECSARCMDGRLGARLRLPRSGEPLPTSSFGEEMRGAVPRRAEGSLSRQRERAHASGGGAAPSSVGGVAVLRDG